jgi:methylated-DNA-[protein]-cysteine S-methyltransferase
MFEPAISYYNWTSPLGKLLLVASAEGLRAIRFEGREKFSPPRPDWIYGEEPFRDLMRQLQEYFAGSRSDFDLPLAPQGTSFQIKVWDALQKIPYGETISYAELAQRIGRPKAVRAVGAANGANPIPILIPCHRVIGSNGALVGYGGGLDIKKHLLALEKEQRAMRLPQRSLF